MSLRRLGVERIDLYQLHRVDPDVPMEDSLGELKAMQDEGKIRHIGVSEVDVDTVRAMRDVVDVVSVQNLYNLTDRQHEDVVDYCDGGRDRRSSRGSRSRPASWPATAARWRRRASGTGARPPSWRSPGCCGGRR